MILIVWPTIPCVCITLEKPSKTDDELAGNLAAEMPTTLKILKRKT